MTFTDPHVVAFESASVDPAKFRHKDHLYVAWVYLRALSLEEALARYVKHLRKLAAALGVPGKYHATITWTYLLLLDEAMHELPDASFEELLAARPALLDHKAGALYDHYDAAELATEAARRRFVLPRARART
jgi:hypothetical protein